MRDKVLHLIFLGLDDTECSALCCSCITKNAFKSNAPVGRDCRKATSTAHTSTKPRSVPIEGLSTTPASFAVKTGAERMPCEDSSSNTSPMVAVCPRYTRGRSGSTAFIGVVNNVLMSDISPGPISFRILQRHLNKRLWTTLGMCNQAHAVAKLSFPQPDPHSSSCRGLGGTYRRVSVLSLLILGQST